MLLLLQISEPMHPIAIQVIQTRYYNFLMIITLLCLECYELHMMHSSFFPSLFNYQNLILNPGRCVHSAKSPTST